MSMKKIALIFLPFLLVGCESLSSSKNKNIAELTPQLSVTSEDPILFGKGLKDYPFDKNFSKLKSHNISHSKLLNAPIIVKGVMYFINDTGQVIAFSKKDKKILWKQDTSDRAQDYNHIGGGIVHNNGKLLVTNGSRFLVVLDVATGFEIVRKEFTDIIRIKPIIVDDKIAVVQTVSNQTYAYDFSIGKLLWQHEGMFETLSSSFYTTPVSYNSNIIVNYSSGQVFSLNAKTGEENWAAILTDQTEMSLPSFEPVTVSCQPIIEDAYIYIASSTGKLAKVALDNGQLLWEAKVSDIQSMNLSGNSIFIINNARQIAALGTDSGRVKWVSKLINLAKDSRKIKAVQFLQPIVTKQDQEFVLSAITTNGELYNFRTSNGQLPPTPEIKQLVKNTNYAGFTCCGDVYLLTDRQIIFIE